MFEIEKDVPLTTRASRASKYPFSEMEVGDSFAVPEEQRAAVRQAIQNKHKQAKADGSSIRYSTRTLANETVRVWRIS